MEETWVSSKAYLEVEELIVCSRCLMDESDPELVFTETGCTHCDHYFQVAKYIFRPYGELEQLAER